MPSTALERLKAKVGGKIEGLGGNIQGLKVNKEDGYFLVTYGDRAYDAYTIGWYLGDDDLQGEPVLATASFEEAVTILVARRVSKGYNGELVIWTGRYSDDTDH